jgi:hypothetical protein
MSENLGASTSRKPKGLHGLYRDTFTYIYLSEENESLKMIIEARISKSYNCLLINSDGD